MLLAYLIAATLLTITPGVDTAMVLRASTCGGSRAAVEAAAGIVAGLLLWGGVVALGLGGVLEASQVAYTALRWAGAAYLFYLGIRLVVRPRGELSLAEDEVEPDVRAWMARGFLSNILNPKIGVFYVTFLPQFVPHGAAVGPWTFLLAVIHALTGVVWFALLISASVPLSRFLRRPRTLRWLDRLTGGVFIAFGARLALSRG